MQGQKCRATAIKVKQPIPPPLCFLKGINKHYVHAWWVVYKNNTLCTEQAFQLCTISIYSTLEENAPTQSEIKNCSNYKLSTSKIEHQALGARHGESCSFVLAHPARHVLMESLWWSSVCNVGACPMPMVRLQHGDFD